MTAFEQYPEQVRNAIPGLLQIPGRRRTQPEAVAKAAKAMWEQLSAKEKLAYLGALRLQGLKDLEAVEAITAELQQEL